jgi:putative copper export protein
MLDALAALVKGLLYAGLLSSAGVILAQATLRPAPTTIEFFVRVVRVGATLTIVAASAAVLILILRLGGRFDEATLSAVFITASGAATCLQIAGAALLLASDLHSDDGRAMRIGNAALMLASFAFNGHAAALGLAQGLVAVLHASAASWWIGSLCLLRYGCARHEHATTELVRRFSAIATWFVGALIFVGLVLIGMLVDFSRLAEIAAYVQLLAFKLFVAAVVLAVATRNRLRLTPRLLAGDATATDSLRQSVDVELWLIGAIAAITAVLTTYTSPHL